MGLEGAKNIAEWAKNLIGYELMHVSVFLLVCCEDPNGNVYTADITTSLAVSDEGSSLKGEKRESGRGARRERKRKRGREEGRRRVQVYYMQ